jgi:exoribonuclease R
MANHVGETYDWRVSGIAEFAYFVELESGIEITVYLPRYSRYIVDSVRGVVSTTQGKRIATIGEKLKIEVTGVMQDERRIVGEKR